MKIGLTPVSTYQIKHAYLLGELEQKLSSFFQAKNYGEDLKEVYIHVIIVSPRLARFFKYSKPTYTFDYKNHILNTVSYSIGRALKYHINLNFEKFNNANEAEAREMIKNEVLSSISLFEQFRKKIKDFNISLFRQDIKHFFEEVAI